MKDDGWIKWHGGECPVPKGTLIDVRFRDGGTLDIADVLDWRWSHKGWDEDIVAYRICEPAEPPAPDTSAENALWHGYAGKALQGLLACPDTTGQHDGFAANAARFADAMLAEARKRGRV